MNIIIIWKELPKTSPEDSDKKKSQGVSSRDKQSRKAQKKEAAEKRQLIGETLKPIQEKLLVLEERISDLEKKAKRTGNNSFRPGDFCR